jgi:hypothetical protein
VFGFGSTKCSKCENTSFKLQEFSPNGTNFKLNAIQCTKCKTPFAVVHNTAALLQQQAIQIASLEKKLSSMEIHIQSIASALRRSRARGSASMDPHLSSGTGRTEGDD